MSSSSRVHDRLARRAFALVATASAVSLASCGGGSPRGPGIARSDVAPGPRDRPLTPIRVSWSHAFTTEEGCDDAHLELVLPFLEGIHVKHPAASLPKTGYASAYLAYPSSLSIPFVAFSCDGDTWTAAYTRELVDAPPLRVMVKTKDAATTLELACEGPCELRTTTATGGWASLARAALATWNVRPGPPPLASRYDALQYYVHRFLDTEGAEPRRVDWDDTALLARVPRESPRTLVQVYGLDWGGIDLRGAYLWSEGAEATWRRLHDASPKVDQLSWLNLRTYKYAIPKMQIDEALPESIVSGLKLYEDGPHEVDQYAFKAKEMCLGSPVWQASRRAELEHLVREGFRVVQLDEFPISPSWDVAPCRATNHLHRPNDAADEWRVARAFVAGLATYARAHDVLLTTEEPNAALLPYVSGYTDGIWNEPQDVYEFWTKSPDIRPVPLFSTLFGARMTPYTRAGVKRAPPAGWLPEWKRTRE